MNLEQLLLVSCFTLQTSFTGGFSVLTENRLLRDVSARASLHANGVVHAVPSRQGYRRDPRMAQLAEQLQDTNLGTTAGGSAVQDQANGASTDGQASSVANQSSSFSNTEQATAPPAGSTSGCTPACHHLALCWADRAGQGHSCTCRAGHSGDGVSSCVALDFCGLEGHACDPAHGVCSIVDGEHTCVCSAGYRGNGTYCKKHSPEAESTSSVGGILGGLAGAVAVIACSVYLFRYYTDLKKKKRFEVKPTKAFRTTSVAIPSAFDSRRMSVSGDRALDGSSTFANQGSIRSARRVGSNTFSNTMEENPLYTLGRDRLNGPNDDISADEELNMPSQSHRGSEVQMLDDLAEVAGSGLETPLYPLSGCESRAEEVDVGSYCGDEVDAAEGRGGVYECPANGDVSGTAASAVTATPVDIQARISQISANLSKIALGQSDSSMANSAVYHPTLIPKASTASHQSLKNVLSVDARKNLVQSLEGMGEQPVDSST